MGNDAKEATEAEGAEVRPLSAVELEQGLRNARAILAVAAEEDWHIHDVARLLAGAFVRVPATLEQEAASYRALVDETAGAVDTWHRLEDELQAERTERQRLEAEVQALDQLRDAVAVELDEAYKRLERLEAEAAVLREALQPFNRSDRLESGWKDGQKYVLTVTTKQLRQAVHALTNTTAGATLLARLGELEGEVREVTPILEAACAYVDADGDILPYGYYLELEQAVANYRRKYQGTPTAADGAGAGAGAGEGGEDA